jgi:hypothetical protein
MHLRSRDHRNFSFQQAKPVMVSPARLSHPETSSAPRSLTPVGLGSVAQQIAEPRERRVVAAPGQECATRVTGVGIHATWCAVINDRAPFESRHLPECHS